MPSVNGQPRIRNSFSNSNQGALMALVRRTEKLRESIDEQLDFITKDKIKRLIKHENFIEKIVTFFNKCIDEPSFFSPDLMNFIRNQGAVLPNKYYGFTQPHVQVVIVSPFDSQYSWNRDYICVLKEFIPSDLFPCIPVPIHPPFLWKSKDDSFNSGISAEIDSHQGNHDTVRTKMVFAFTIPYFKAIENDDGTYRFDRINTAQKPSRAGKAVHTLNHSYMVNETKVSTIDPEIEYNGDKELFDLFLSFQNDQDSIMRVIERYQKTREYIFGELWKLPSLNKMVDFFPAIKAFLDDETLERLNKGAKKRKEYNVALPDQEAIAAATEASIKL
jgi:hypothetical protein